MREIPHFPCIKPDLAKTIVLTEERKIVEKPADIWANPEDYVVQYKYDGQSACLIGPNTPAKSWLCMPNVKLSKVRTGP